MVSLSAALLLSVLVTQPPANVLLEGKTVVGVKNPVVFAGDEVVIKVTRLGSDRSEKGSRRRAEEWRLRRLGQNTHSVVTPRAKSPVISGSQRLSFGALPPGDYELELLLTEVTIQRVPFAVRDGSESKELAIALLWEKARHATDYDKAKRLYLELRELEPLNPYVLEQLANRSLDGAPPDETLAWFQQARQLVISNVKRYEERSGKRMSPEEEDEVKATLDRYSLFEQVFPFYLQHREELRFMPLRSPAPYGYVWVRRSTGEVLGAVDPSKDNMLAPITVKVGGTFGVRPEK